MPDNATDLHPTLVKHLLHANQSAYTRLVVVGAAPAQANALLSGVKPSQLIDGPVTSPAAASAMLAGLWLWHDALDECHRIVQKSPGDLGEAGPAQEMTATLAYWHAINHRREGDFSNSKYWNARCRNHPVFAPLGAAATSLLPMLPATTRLNRVVADGWNPDAFVDLVEEVHDRGDDVLHAAAVRLQQLEWHALFDYCARVARK